MGLYAFPLGLSSMMGAKTLATAWNDRVEHRAHIEYRALLGWDSALS